MRQPRNKSYTSKTNAAKSELDTTQTIAHHFQSSLVSLKRRRCAAELAYKRLFTTQTKCPSAISLKVALIFTRGQQNELAACAC